MTIGIHISAVSLGIYLWVAWSILTAPVTIKNATICRAGSTDD